MADQIILRYVYAEVAGTHQGTLPAPHTDEKGPGSIGMVCTHTVCWAGDTDDVLKEWQQCNAKRTIPTKNVMLKYT